MNSTNKDIIELNENLTHIVMSITSSTVEPEDFANSSNLGSGTHSQLSKNETPFLETGFVDDNSSNCDPWMSNQNDNILLDPDLLEISGSEFYSINGLTLPLQVQDSGNCNSSNCDPMRNQNDNITLDQWHLDLLAFEDLSKQNFFEKIEYEMEVMSRTSSALNKQCERESTEWSLQQLNVNMKAPGKLDSEEDILEEIDIRSKQQKDEPALPKMSCFEIINQSKQNPNDPCKLDEFVESMQPNGSEFTGRDLVSLPILDSNEIMEFFPSLNQSQEETSSNSDELHTPVQESSSTRNLSSNVIPNDNLVMRPNNIMAMKVNESRRVNKQQAQQAGDKRKLSDGRDINVNESESCNNLWCSSPKRSKPQAALGSQSQSNSSLLWSSLLSNGNRAPQSIGSPPWTDPQSNLRLSRLQSNSTPHLVGPQTSILRIAPIPIMVQEMEMDDWDENSKFKPSKKKTKKSRR